MPNLEDLDKGKIKDKVSQLIFGDKQQGYLEFKAELEKLLRIFIQKSIEESSLNKYFVAFLWTQGSISDYHLGRIYQHLKSGNVQDKEKGILLVINSPGGAIGPAFQISKICNKYKGEKKFIVAIPRQAKSAATLISVGANEIHMGDLGQLGPIDPQLPNGMPVIGVHDALIALAEIVTKHPEAVTLFARFLEKKMNLEILGWLTRIPQSASQYAQKLLKINYGQYETKIQDIAKVLVEGYKHHGFVIDADEAETIFGVDISKKLIKKNSGEIKAVESLYEELSSLEFLINAKWIKPDIKLKIEIDLIGGSYDLYIREIQTRE